MKAAPNRPLSFLGLTPVAIVAIPVALAAWLLAGPTGMAAATVGAFVAALIFAAAELLVLAAGVEQPLERLMLGMLVRAAGGVTAIGLAVLGAGIEPKLIAGVALPLYGALLAGEVLVARSMQTATETE